MALDQGYRAGMAGDTSESRLPYEMASTWRIAAGSAANRTRSENGTDSTHCRIGSEGSTDLLGIGK